jgi:hypothetical protein
VTPEATGADRPEDGLSPADEERVRRLLSAAGGPVTVPEDVAARLDTVLAALRDERGETGAAPVVDLAARRRRRWPSVLVAAAAVAVVGAGLGNLVQNGLGGSGGDSMSAVTSRDTAGDGGAESAPEAGAPDRDADGGGAAAPEAARERVRVLFGSAPTTALPRIRREAASADAERIYVATGPVATRDPGDLAGGLSAGRCALPAVDSGERLVAVRLDGQRATLVFGADPDGPDGHRPATVFACDDGRSPLLVTGIDAP